MFVNILDRGRELLARAHSGGIEMRLVDGRILMSRPDPAPAELLEELRAEREAIVVALTVPTPTAEQEQLRDAAGWIILDRAIGDCVLGDGPCRSWDSENRPRHLSCRIETA